MYLYDIDVVYCGCFTGTLNEFEDAVERKYGDDKMRYDIAIETFRGKRENFLKNN